MTSPLASLLSAERKEKLKLLIRDGRIFWSKYKHNRTGIAGLGILVFFVSMAFLAPLIGQYDELYPPNSLEWARVNPTLSAPSADHLFGTDLYGRDIFTLTMYGARASLIVGLMASAISIILGTGVGVAAGYLGKSWDELLMRVTDFFLVIPWLPLMIVFAMLMGKSFTNVIIVIGITSWPWTARIVRSQVLSVKEKAFVVRARCIGAGSFTIVRKHIMPNVLPLVFASTILLIANAIFSESFLEFLGLGGDMISWGNMLEAAYDGHAFESYAWWWILPPGLFIIVLIMAFYLVGEATDEILNPKLRRR
ncbi:MAG: ABC transporter permease [Thermoplasmata archaeon]|jgi:peptide/nickel transport system permease protein|nr:ABC transporter permease [Thermoplasmata archaeon]